jgi:hypothetical protein
MIKERPEAARTGSVAVHAQLSSVGLFLALRVLFALYLGFPFQGELSLSTSWIS